MTTATTDNRRKKTRVDSPRSTGRRTVDASALTSYLGTLELGVSPKVHVNGHNFAMALVTVDFGSPLKQVKLTQDENQEFSDRLRKLARDVLGRDANIRISHDGPNGIFWASIA